MKPLVEEEEQNTKSYVVYKKQENSHFDAKEGSVKNDTSMHHECKVDEVHIGC